SSGLAGFSASRLPRIHWRGSRAPILSVNCRQRHKLALRRYSTLAKKGPMVMRPRSLAEIAERAAGRTGVFDLSVREFLDSWQTMPADQRPGALAAEPASLGKIQDAYLAALAEHLALESGLVTPEWTEQPDRYLSEPFFA